MSDQAQISILRYPDSVRLRKEMYLMDASHCVFEIVDNAVDEHSADHCTAIALSIIGDTVTVEDNGRGIPVTPHADPEYSGLSQAEVAFTVLHAGGKFGKEDGYQTVTGGLHGVGASCVQAVSSETTLTIMTGGNKYQATFSKGHITEGMHVIETGVERTGTEVSFRLDPEIWDEERFDIKKIRKRMRQLAYLNPGLLIYVVLDTKDKDGTPVKLEEEHRYPEGIKSYTSRLLKGKTAISDVFSYAKSLDDMEISVAFAFTDGYTEELLSFCNNIATEQGGDHLAGTRAGIAAAVQQYGRESGAFKEKTDVVTDDILEGIVGIVSVKVHDPKFEGQGKSKIRMPEVRTQARKIVEEFFFDYLSQNQQHGKIITDKVLTASKARQAAKKAREAARNSKELTNTAGLPGKLADCSEKDPALCELFMVEGDSAAGSAKQGRDRVIQAILPVFGKILNVEKSRLDVVTKNPKLQDVVKALKCGIGKEFDVSKVRYHKIILMSDADVDGHHIQCLNLVFFYRYMREIIEKGYLYIAVPPLFMVTKGKQITYLYSKEELEAFDTTDATVQRYKGLGEMDPEQLWETTMNPETRRLVQVTIEDAETTEEYLSICMGEDTDVRKQFIMDNYGELTA